MFVVSNSMHACEFSEMKFKHALIDADMLIYACGFSIEYRDREMDIIRLKEGHTLQNAFWNLDSMVKKILDTTGAEEKTLYLTDSGKSNFRYSIYPDYKKNREGTRRPIYYKELREYIQSNFQSKVALTEEADDLISIDYMTMYKEDFNGIICSRDKDFNNTPGWHYNYHTNEIYNVEVLAALRNFYLQILTGDNSDGIPRIRKGWLKKKTEEALKECQNETQMYNTIKNEVYRIKDLNGEFNGLAHLGNVRLNPEGINRRVGEEILFRGRLVWLRRKPDEMWVPNLERC